MGRTDEELEAITERFEKWTDEVDPSTLDWEDPADLREVTQATDALEEAEERLLLAVAAARANGRSWPRIAIGLNTSPEAAQQRFADKIDTVDV